MPTKGKLPTAREIEGQILAALHELNGDAHYKNIDEQVRENLDWVYVREFRKETQTFYETAFAGKCATARRSLRKQGSLIIGARGHWRLNVVPPPKPSKIRKPGTSRVENFAAESLERLESKGVSPDAINAIRELWLEFRMATPAPSPDAGANREVEEKALKFIQEKEKSWRRPANSNNKGFDLYQTESGRKNGKIIQWCEVKSLSGKFNRVSLTKAEFECAQEHGENYWLYIVENVALLDQGGEPNLIRIQNPAGKAERFSYGNSDWSKAAQQ